MNRIRCCKSTSLMLAALLLSGCAASPPPVAADKGIGFSAAERERIERYYAEARRGPATAPAALFRPGDKLESGARPQPLPGALKVMLPDLAEPYTRLIVGADVLLVNRRSHDIVDVIPAVAY